MEQEGEKDVHVVTTTMLLKVMFPTFTVEQGVAQDFSLSPTLFSIFISDLLNELIVITAIALFMCGHVHVFTFQILQHFRPVKLLWGCAF